MKFLIIEYFYIRKYLANIVIYTINKKNSKKYLLSIPTYKKWQTSGGSLCMHIAQCFQDSNSLSKYCYHIVWTETNEETVS